MKPVDLDALVPLIKVCRSESGGELPKPIASVTSFLGVGRRGGLGSLASRAELIRFERQLERGWGVWGALLGPLTWRPCKRRNASDKNSKRQMLTMNGAGSPGTPRSHSPRPFGALGH